MNFPQSRMRSAWSESLMAGVKVFLIGAIIAISIISAAGRAVNISNTWVLPEEGFPVFYRYFRDRISWNEADAVCQFHHANLVTVDTTSEYDAIRAYLKELDVTNNIWIGLTRANDKSNFVWRDFRTLSLADYWQEAIPTGNDPLCVAMDPSADFRWHAFPCGGPTVASFICELPVPSWASGPQGCLLTELPSLTVLFIPEQSAVELTSDCGLDGTKRIACKGNTNREEMMQRLRCTESADVLEDKPQSSSPTAANKDSTFTETNTAHPSNMKTTKPWIWTSNTIDTEDYGSPTRHRRETEDTLSPSSTKSTTAHILLKSTTEYESTNEFLTTETVTVSSPNEPVGSTELDIESSTTETAKTEISEEYPSAISQGQLFSIIENGTMFDIIELNGTDENKSATVENKNYSTPSSENSTPLFTTVIYQKEPTEDAVTPNFKIIPTVMDSKLIKNYPQDHSSDKQSEDKKSVKDIKAIPVGNSLIKLNRTNRKELPISTNILKPDESIDIDVENGLVNEPERSHKTVEIRIHNPGQENTSKSILFVTTKGNDKNDKGYVPKKATEKFLKGDKSVYRALKNENNKVEHKSAQTLTTPTDELTSSPPDNTSAAHGEFTTAGTIGTKSLQEESLNAEPTTRPNRQRQLTRPQRRSYYPYFFSRVLG